MVNARYPNIEEERWKQMMPINKLADSIGVTRTTYRLWQQGKSEIKYIDAAALAKVLNKPVEYLLEEKKDAKSESGEDA